MKKRRDRRRRDPRPIVGWAKTIRLRDGRVLHAENYGIQAFPIRGSRSRSHWDQGRRQQKRKVQPQQLVLGLQPKPQAEPMRARRRQKK